MRTRNHGLAVLFLTVALVGASCSDRSDEVVASDDVESAETTAPAEDTPKETTTVAPEVEETTTAEPATEVVWDEVVPGGDCQCADGSEYRFWVREADPTKVVFFLQGGGACFDPTSCDFEDGNYSVTADADDDPSDAEGLFDFDNPDNPFADWSFVFVPYCTGDIHLGTRTNEYSPELVVNHVGSINATTALDEMVTRFPDAAEIVVAGESAGSAPTPLYAGMAADRYPDARVAVLADGSGAYPDVPAVNATIGALWGTRDVLPDWPGVEGLAVEELSLPDLFVFAAAQHPDILFARHDYAFDETQVFFGTLAGFGGDDLVELIDGNEVQIEAGGVDLSSYISPGESHTVLGQNAVYTETLEGVALIDWIATVASFESPGDVHCIQCEPPAST